VTKAMDDGPSPEQRPAPTRRGVHDRLNQLTAVHDNGFRPERTLRVRVELVRQLGRRRTQLTLLVLLALPVIIALAFQISADTGSSGATRDGSPVGSRAPALVTLATAALKFLTTTS